MYSWLQFSFTKLSSLTWALGCWIHWWDDLRSFALFNDLHCTMHMSISSFHILSCVFISAPNAMDLLLAEFFSLHVTDCCLCRGSHLLLLWLTSLLVKEVKEVTTHFILTKVSPLTRPVVVVESWMMDALLCIWIFSSHVLAFCLLHLFDPTDHSCYKRRLLDTSCCDWCQSHSKSWRLIMCTFSLVAAEIWSLLLPFIR